MNRNLTRRDFFNGTALAIAGWLTPLAQLRADAGRYYPPALTGLRGSNPGSFEIAHQVGREGRAFDVSRQPVEEMYDLVVVGGGISGLSAAWFYREEHGAARAYSSSRTMTNLAVTRAAMNSTSADDSCSAMAAHSHWNDRRRRTAL